MLNKDRWSRYNTQIHTSSHVCLTMSMSLVTELAMSETEELASVRRLLSSGVWPLGLLLALLEMALQAEGESQHDANQTQEITYLFPKLYYFLHSFK